MNKKVKEFFAVLALSSAAASASAATLSGPRHVFVEMANGAKYGSYDQATYGGTDSTSYYIKADGGGLNALHITSSPSTASGQVTNVTTTDGTASGTFYVSTTGGTGYFDDIILMMSVKPDGTGNVPSNLSVTIKSSGYAFPLSTPSSATYYTNVVNQTFTTTDFNNATYGYGHYAYKPGPNGITGNYTTWNLPIYYGQTDFTTGEQYIFVDLKLGNINNTTLTDGGDVKVDFSISGLTTALSFDAYAWSYTSPQGEGINWTQDTKAGDLGVSGYRIVHN